MTIKLQDKQKEISAENMINVGEITGAHGIKGQVKVAALTDFPQERFAPGSKLYSPKLGRTVEVLTSGIHKGLYLLLLDGVDNRDSAQALLHTYLQVPQSSLAALPEGEFYHFQLIGLKVYEGDKLLGELTEVMQTGANDVYVITSQSGHKPSDILLPALKSCILDVDLQAGTMAVKIPEGLLD